MSAYLFVKIIHILAAIALVGPLALAPRWLTLSNEPVAQRMLNDLHLQTSIAGWTLLIAGVAILYVLGGSFLGAFWMQISIGLYLFVQVFDHFWADKREEQLANGLFSAVQPLRIWLIAKLVIYCGIAAVMVLKPS
jgi:hypothetical protein